MLKIRDIDFSYKHHNSVLKNIQMNVDIHEILAILGPNGVGKSTLLKCINGLLKVRKGTVLVDSDDIHKMKRADIAKRIGYVPQRADVTQITVFDSVLLGRKPHITWDVSKKDIKITKDTLTQFGLDALSLTYNNEISGGELQKVQIARALVQEPKVLLLDEPTSSLDLCNQHKIMATIVDIVKHSNITAIMTVHDLNLALRYADKFILLKDGKIFAAGDHSIITPKTIEAVYGLPVTVQTYQNQLIIIPK